MTMTTKKKSVEEEGGAVRGGEQWFYFLCNSSVAPNSAALYRFRFSIIFDEDDIILLNKNKTHVIGKVAELFPQDHNRRTSYAAIAPLVVCDNNNNNNGSSSSKYLLLPNEFDETFYIRNKREPCTYPREEPLLYTLGLGYFRGSVEKSKQPSGLKVEPMAVTVGNKVYALSRRNSVQRHLPEPSFEAYDPVKNEWETLPPPWVNKDSNEDWDSPGYAGHFIIVCFHNRSDKSKLHIQCYNTVSREWKPVSYPRTGMVLIGQYNHCIRYSVDRFYSRKDSATAAEVPKYTAADYLVWNGEAVVAGSYIYGYVETFKTLVWFKCSSSEKGDLSIGGYVFMEHCDSCKEGGTLSSSGAVGRIGDDMICLVKTVFSDGGDIYREPVHIATFRLSEQGGIRARLQSFDLFMLGDELFHHARISSCLIQPPEVASSKGGH